MKGATLCLARELKRIADTLLTDVRALEDVASEQHLEVAELLEEASKVGAGISAIRIWQKVIKSQPAVEVLVGPPPNDDIPF